MQLARVAVPVDNSIPQNLMMYNQMRSQARPIGGMNMSANTIA